MIGTIAIGVTTMFCQKITFHEILGKPTVVRPDRAQAALLDRLGLHLPERLRVRLA